MDNNIFRISINDLRIWVHLGCGDEEKFHPQMVSLDIDVDFKILPKAAESDSIQDTICYFDLIQGVTKYCENKKFNLIEHLAKSIHDEVVKSVILHNDIVKSINVNVHKISPPVPNLHGGVRFTHCINY